MFDKREAQLLFHSEHKFHCAAENGNSSKFTYFCPSSSIPQLKHLGFAVLTVPNPGAVIEEDVV